MLSEQGRKLKPLKEKQREKKDGEAMKNNEQDQTIFTAMAKDVQDADIPQSVKDQLLKTSPAYKSSGST